MVPSHPLCSWHLSWKQGGSLRMATAGLWDENPSASQVTYTLHLECSS